MRTERLHSYLPLTAHNHRLSWHEEPELNLSWPESYWIKLIFERLSFTEQEKCQRREALCSWQMTREAVSLSECAHEGLQTVNCNYGDFEVAYFCRINLYAWLSKLKWTTSILLFCGFTQLLGLQLDINRQTLSKTGHVLRSSDSQPVLVPHGADLQLPGGACKNWRAAQLI